MPDTSIKLHHAIKAINADAQFQYQEEDINTIVWFNNTTPISAEDILAKKTELEQAQIKIDNPKENS
jgi:hypothetical protein